MFRYLPTPGGLNVLNLILNCIILNIRLPIFFLSTPFQKGLKNVFDEAILAALEPPEPKKSRRCVLL